MDYIIGIDCGGTKTKCVAYDLNGKALATRLLGPGNIALAPRETIATLIVGIDQLTSELDGNCVYILAGIAGVSTAGLAPVVENELAIFDCPVRVVNDGELALIAQLQGKEGIAITCGTGSVVLGMFGGKFYRVGGYGHLLGDEGSGFWLVCQFLKHLTQQLDIGKSLTELDALSQAYLKQKKMGAPLEAVATIYQKNKAEVAEDAFFLHDAAQNGNQDAQALFDQGALALARQALTLISRLNVRPAQLNVSFNGGVITHNPSMKATLVEELKHYFPITEIESNADPTYGAYLFFRAQLKL